MRGEGAVKKAEMKVYKELLLAMRARLRGQVNHMADAALGKNGAEATGDLSKMPIHMADLGTENFEQEFTLGLVENEEETLRKIEASLERIEDGTYGDCEECGAKIPKARLEAVPYAALCVHCACIVRHNRKKATGRSLPLALLTAWIQAKLTALAQRGITARY